MFHKKLKKNKFAHLLGNQDCRLDICHLTEDFQAFFRNADFDELYFIHQGSARVETVYGHLEVKQGDYLVLPRGTTYKIYLKQEVKALRVESKSEFEQPSRGLLGPNALYDETLLQSPEAALGTEKGKEFEVNIKRLGKITKVTYPFNPLDVIGWKGSVYPWKLSIYDIAPIMSHRYHIPPSGHTTFVCKNFVVCSFVARPLESSDHGVLKVPFYHSNIDFDEVLFYHKGDFFSRDNIDEGAMTFHPQGIHHGPHPKAYEKSQEKLETNEFAVMIDCKNPLIPSSWFSENENKDYWRSWMEA